MRSWRRRLGSAVLTLIGACCVPSVKGQLFGGPTYCVNCSDEVTTLTMKATQAMQYLREAQTALRALSMAQALAREGIALAKHPSTNIMTDLGMLSTIMIQSQGLAGDLAQMDQQFRQTYGNYNGPDATTRYALQYYNWAGTSLKTINGALNAAGFQSGMLQKEGLWMQQIQAMNQMPLGQDASIQLGNTIATQEVAQLQALRQLMIADMTAKGAFAAQQMNAQQSQIGAQQNGFTDVPWAADQTTY